MNRYLFGLLLGCLFSLIVFFSNVIFPQNIPDNDQQLLIGYLTIALIFILSGYFTSGKESKIRQAASGGAVIAYMSIGITMLSFVLIDNLFLDTVSQQSEKIMMFKNQIEFSSIRDFINNGLLRGIIIGVPIATFFGAFLGTLGGLIKLFLTRDHDFTPVLLRRINKK